MAKTYKYTTVDKKEHEIELDEQLEAMASQAMKDFETSRKYIDQKYYDIWRYALKMYHMSTYDRKVGLPLKSWQTNISIGLIRSFVDVLVAAVEERPLTFIGTPINKKGLDNKENILKALNYVSDVTGFHRTIKQSLKNGLILGTIAMRINYLKTDTKTTITTIIEDEAVERVVEVEDGQEKDFPCATNVSIFNIFPDPHGGRLRYVIERGVISHYELITTFGNMISHSDNKSPFKDPKFIEALPMKENKNGSDLFDYGNIVDQIYSKANEELRAKDFYNVNSNQMRKPVMNTQLTADEDSDVTKGLLEFHYGVYDDRIVLHVNGYPVYIGPNFYGFINYVIKAAGDDSIRFGEGIPFMLKGLEEIATSFICNYVDGARSIANPTFVAIKNLLLNEAQLESGQPGGTIWIEGGNSREVVSRLDKGGLNSFDIYPLITQIAQQITGISEYNLGQSAGERTATGALSVSQSSNKRMVPYMSTFIDAISVVATMWLSLMKKNWTKKQWIYVLDENGNQVFEQLKNTQLTGGINISLQAEGLFGSTNEIELQKLIQIYQTLAPGGAVKSGEIASEIFKKAGFTPSRFVTNPDQVKPDAMGGPETRLANPDASMGDILKEAASPQINLGNGGEGK